MRTNGTAKEKPSVTVMVSLLIWVLHSETVIVLWNKANEFLCVTLKAKTSAEFKRKTNIKSTKLSKKSVLSNLICIY